MAITEEVQYQEHQAWLKWCREFKRQTGLDLNEKKFTPMCKLIEAWGERYHQMIVAKG